MKNYFVKILLFLSFVVGISCSKDDNNSTEVTPKPVETTISSGNTSVSFDAAGGNSNITITMTGKDWVVISDQSWCTTSVSSSSLASQQITVTATANSLILSRAAVLTFVMDGNAQKTIKVTISQAASASLYPSYNANPIAADASGMSSTAVELAAKMKLGWNIGNTMEATGGETAWGNPKVTKALIDLVKANGFNAIRIPCSWNQYANASTAKLQTVWIDRVKEVVQYCVDNDMYVIINIHWDGGWLEKNCTEAQKVENNAKQKAFWEQIATNLRGFDEHLLFASTNEPNVANATEMAVLLSYHQTFIDAVRSTGGKNAYRNLIIQGPSTDIEQTNKLMTTLPIDTATGRMMAEVHFYPYQFTLMTKDESWGKMFYYWGAGNHSTTDTAHNPTWGEEADIDKFFLLMKTQFVDKGIPVILGEFGAIRRSNLTGDALTLHLKSRADFYKYVVKSSKANGMIPFYWDAGGDMGVNTMTLFNRSNNTVFDSQALNGLLDGLK